MKTYLNIVAAVVLLIGAAFTLPAQTDGYQTLSPQDMDTLVGPIALYPDPLIAQILPASTLPTQIVMADRYIQGGGDPNQIEQQPWDPSVQAVAHYPDVLKWLDDNLNWTTELGEAFANQQQDVMESVQRLRTTALSLGNLQSSPQQQVINDGGQIEVVPVAPDVMYVPQYDPSIVYVDSGCDIGFGIGFPIGLWLNCDFDWHNRHLFIWDHNHPRPPNWWHEKGNQHEGAFSGHTTEWHPVHRPPSGPTHWVDRGYNNPGGPRDISHPSLSNGVKPRPQTHSVPPTEIHVNHVNNTAPHNDNNNVHVGPTIGETHNNNPPPAQHFTPTPAPHVDAPRSSDAFIGIDNSRNTRTYSDRGSQSMGTAPRPAPAPAPVEEHHSSPPPSGGGGGGGGGGGHRH